MYPALLEYIDGVLDGVKTIAAGRKERLNEIVRFAQDKCLTEEPVNLTFICTHNSRRSQFGQVWAATAAAYYGVDGKLKVFSGGTEVTAFHRNAVGALTRAGFEIENPGGANPPYRLSFSKKKPAITCFSKKYYDPPNPLGDFAAIMTCSEADRNCPFIPGAAIRVSLPYHDPKEADGTPEEIARYDDRCKQIATEMFYVFSTWRSKDGK